jgi:hypothetical protein
MIPGSPTSQKCPKKRGGKKPTSGYCKISKSLYFTVFKKNCKSLFLEKFRRKKKKEKIKGAVLAVGDIARDFPSNFLVLNYV